MSESHELHENIVDAAQLGPDKAQASDALAKLVVSDMSTPDTLAQGSMWKAIWTMSWPLIIATVGSSVIGLVDVQVAGILGSNVQAAVGLAEHVIFVFTIVVMSIGVGTTAIVSRAWGENDRDAANYGTGQSLSLSVLLGVGLAVLAILTAHCLVPLFAQSPDVISMADTYLSIYALYLVPFSIVCIANAAFRAIGNARITLLIILTEVTISVAGDYLTVLGNWPVPGLGIRGIAGSSIVGSLLAALVALVCLSRSMLKASLSNTLPLSSLMVRRILNVGLPSACHRISYVVSIFVIFFILKGVPNPTAALASWTIGVRMEAILFMPLMALSMAVSAIVGQCLGARDTGRAFRASWYVAAMASAFMVIVASALFAFARPLASLMSHDPKTIECAASYLRIAALSQPFRAIDMIFAGALYGAGDTRSPMWILVFTNLVIRLPLAWWLASAVGWGADGAWIAISGSAVVASILIVIRFQSGIWTKQQV